MADVKYIVRVANTDLKGHKDTLFALTGIDGVSMSMANAICAVTGVAKTQKLGLLTEADVKKLNDFFVNPTVPSWLLNRRKDYETGEDMHIFGAELSYTVENDIKRLKKIKSNRGMRHQWGLPMRGQQTKSNHRRTKAKKASAAKKAPKKAVAVPQKKK